jgi:hypothetical protein
MTRVAELEARARRAVAWMSTDRGADVAFRAALVLAIPLMYVVGRRQWFIRDDWHFVITRDEIRHTLGWQDWLFLPTAGHWMTAPLLAYRAIDVVAGTSSYWPYLALNLAVHTAMVLMVRLRCRRHGVSAWTTTLVCAGLLVFGAGWENIVFAIQITYGFSILALLVQMHLVDHEGPVDRRDVLGAAVAVVGVMSSGFGPFCLVGITVLLGLRRRGRALALAVGPAGVAFVWWWLTWGRFSPEEFAGGSMSNVPAYAVRGIVAAFEALGGITGLGAVITVGAIGVAWWHHDSWQRQSMTLALWATAIVTYVGVGTQRVAFGIENAAISRYIYVGAMLLAPVFALAVDQLGRWGRYPRLAGRSLLVVSVVLSAGSLATNGATWGLRASEERRTLELIAGSDLLPTADPTHRPLPFSPDVRVSDIAELVADGTIHPIVPSSPAEVEQVRQALGLAPTGG